MTQSRSLPWPATPSWQTHGTVSQLELQLQHSSQNHLQMDTNGIKGPTHMATCSSQANQHPQVRRKDEQQMRILKQVHLDGYKAKTSKKNMFGILELHHTRQPILLGYNRYQSVLAFGTWIPNHEASSFQGFYKELPRFSPEIVPSPLPRSIRP